MKVKQTTTKLKVTGLAAGDRVVSWTSFPGDAGLQAEQLLLDMRDQILGGQVSVADGLKNTQDQINALLDAQ